MSEWNLTMLSKPPEGVEVDTKIHDDNGSRNEFSLIWHGGLWFIPGHDMYVYYMPTHWKQKAPAHNTGK